MDRVLSETARPVYPLGSVHDPIGISQKFASTAGCEVLFCEYNDSDTMSARP